MSELEGFEEGEKVLFNDRKTPLTVQEVSEEELVVEGPGGGEYEIYFDEDTLLVCRKGNKRYSSYCEDLRSVGEWVRDGDCWRHSKTEAEISIVQNENGFYELESKKFQGELDNPAYGFTNKEAALEEAEKVVESNPEG
ncbi:hypothetical protein [Candidatus Nanohalobium constans]|uniref:Uncharacterized protein n=1 Tax=Candidatus Nanohalobium constans TaxID=2565781 RepID=A0A5Q0UFU1_9ARCH|nr:hypothetical protein [Candidatus Nanohalobium constans]QGA80492.1 hypothetical protein LC1Nh_0598 [Candidatus Nanohalobium constans]